MDAPDLQLQQVSVTRKMAASLPRLRSIAQGKGLKMHHLGAGYPHPEVTDPRRFLQHQSRYFEFLEKKEGVNEGQNLPEYLRESYSYTDTLGPKSTRECFARIYGRDWGLEINPELLIPTVGASGGINLICSMFERPGKSVAYITDAPTYPGFTARVGLCQHAKIFSVEMAEEGAKPDEFERQILKARKLGHYVPFYYTVPDGHNPAGFSFSQSRRQQLLEIARKLDVLIVEDAPYVYINFAGSADRPDPFFVMDPKQTVHLFTGSKIGFPGPRVGFFYSEANLQISGGKEVSIAELALTESSSDILFQNPASLRGFESMLHDEDFNELQSMWPLAEVKLAVYRENRSIMLEVLERELGAYPDQFKWTKPEAGFFSVFTINVPGVKTDDEFVEKLVADYGVVVIPMYDFYPADAKERNPFIGFDQLRLSFCFSESLGEERRQDLREAVEAFCNAMKELIS